MFEDQRCTTESSLLKELASLLLHNVERICFGQFPECENKSDLKLANLDHFPKTNNDLAMKFAEDSDWGKVTEKDLEEYISKDASVGDTELYWWMYNNGFIRGGSGWMAFTKIQNNQKDTIISIVERNEKMFKTIKTEIGHKWIDYE